MKAAAGQAADLVACMLLLGNLSFTIGTHMRATPRGLLSCLFLAASTICATARLPAEPANLDKNVIAEFDVFNDGDCLLLPVRVDGKTHQFLVATGQPYSMIDERLVEVPKRWEKMPPFDDPDYNPPLHESPMLGVGPMKFGPGKPCVIDDMKPYQEVTGHAIRGALGADFLMNYVLQLDSAAGKLRFLRHPGKGRSGELIPFVIDQGKPKINLRLPSNTVVENCPINTMVIGSNLGLTKELFEEQFRAGFVDRLSRGMVFGRGVGNGNNLTGRLNFFQVGGLEIRSTSVATSPKSTVGLGFLLRYNVIFDFPAKRMLLSPREGTPYQEYDKRSGLGVILPEQTVRVAYVLTESPAANAEIEGGDILVTVNDKPAINYRLHQIRRLLGGDAREVRLRLRRDDREFDVNLNLDSPEQRVGD